MADEGRVLQAVLGKERGDILGHGGIIVPRGMGGLPVVAQVLVSRVVRRGGAASSDYGGGGGAGDNGIGGLTRV